MQSVKVVLLLQRGVASCLDEIVLVVDDAHMICHGAVVTTTIVRNDPCVGRTRRICCVVMLVERDMMVSVRKCSLVNCPLLSARDHDSNICAAHYPTATSN